MPVNLATLSPKQKWTIAEELYNNFREIELHKDTSSVGFNEIAYYYDKALENNIEQIIRKAKDIDEGNVRIHYFFGKLYNDFEAAQKFKSAWANQNRIYKREENRFLMSQYELQNKMDVNSFLMSQFVEQYKYLQLELRAESEKKISPELQNERNKIKLIAPEEASRARQVLAAHDEAVQRARQAAASPPQVAAPRAQQQAAASPAQPVAGRSAYSPRLTRLLKGKLRRSSAQIVNYSPDMFAGILKANN
jgi:hypothetical protein